MRGIGFLFRRRTMRSILRGMLQYLFGRRGQRLVTGLRLAYRMRMMVIERSAEPLGKLARVSEVRLWVDGNEAFRRIEKLLRHAQHTIFVQMFIWIDDATGRRIASALVDAADRGVEVEVTKEAVGDFFEMNRDFLGTRHSSHECWRRFWHHPRIRVMHATNHDHAKVYVIDDQILLLTGMNISDDYATEYHDYLVELRGSEFVEQYLMRRPSVQRGESVHLVMNTEEQKQIRGVLMGLIAGAQDSIVVEHVYVSDPEVIDGLLDALRRGVRVTIIMTTMMDFHYFANMSSIGRLLSEGRDRKLRIFLYERKMHAKAILFDSDTAFVGSANLIRSSLDDMGEVNVLVRGRHRFLRKLHQTMREDILRSRALSTPPPFLWLTRWIAWLGL